MQDLAAGRLAAERPMLCPQCQSSKRKEFRTEMMIHNGGLNGGRPDLFTFPKASVCLDCGFSTFTLMPSDLLDLREARVEAGARG
jgi:hypothetical protein